MPNFEYTSYISDEYGQTPVLFVKSEDGSIKLAPKSKHQLLRSPTPMRQSFIESQSAFEETAPTNFFESSPSEISVRRQSIDSKSAYEETSPTNFLERWTSKTPMSMQSIYRETIPTNIIERSSPNILLRNRTGSVTPKSPINSLEENKNSLKSMSNDLNELTFGVTQALQIGAQVFIDNQQKTLDAINSIRNQIKKLEQTFEDSMDILQNDYKKAQEDLEREFNKNSKVLKYYTEDQISQLTRKMEELNELNQESKNNYFKSQEKVFSYYKKMAKDL